MSLSRIFVLFVLGVGFGQSRLLADCGTFSFDIGSGTIIWSTDVDFMTAGCPQPFLDPINLDVNFNLRNATTLVFDEDLTINGDMNFTNGGNVTLFVPDTVVLTIQGNTGDAGNNNVIWDVDGMLIVRDTLFGKNNNEFVGTGSISGGVLIVKNGAICGAACPIEGGFVACFAGIQDICAIYNVLPIELLFFSAKANENNVRLDWATSSEVNFHYFSIQRSKDALEFEEIARVEGAGYSVVGINYFYEDTQPLPGISYYRLKAVDFDGTFEIFHLISVEYEPDEIFRFSPNPVSADSFLQVFNNNQDGESVLVMYDPAGRLVFKTNLNPGVNHLQFEKRLNPGIYVVRIFASRSAFTERVIIQ